MSPNEVAVLLTYASAIDPRVRRVDDEQRRLQVSAWHAQLEHVSAADARAAVDRHYSVVGADALMPAQVRALVGAEQHPGYRPLAEALDAAEHGPGDRLAADRDEPVPAIEGPAPRSGREALQTAFDELADRMRASAEAQPSSPTGYVRRRDRGQAANRSAPETSKRLGAEQREARRRGERAEPAVDGKTDAERARAGKPITICHGCAVDIPAPDGWDPHDVTSPALYCGRCMNRLDKLGVDPAQLGPRDSRGAALLAGQTGGAGR